MQTPKKKKSLVTNFILIDIEKCTMYAAYTKNATGTLILCMCVWYIIMYTIDAVVTAMD